MDEFMNQDTATLVLTTVVGLAIGTYIPYKILETWAKGEYQRMKNNPKTECDIDEHVGAPERNPVSALKVVFATKAQLGSRKVSSETIPLEKFASPFIPGLNVIRREGQTTPENVKEVQKLGDFLKGTGGKKPVVVMTIRMGFGHHRLAYSTVSWALGMGHPTVFHDMLNIDSDQAELLVSTDDLYSKLSRLATELGGTAEKILGNLLLQGDADALRVAALTATHLQPLVLAYPRDTPIITTHQIAALCAVAAGFTNVVNLVGKFRPMWF